MNSARNTSILNLKTWYDIFSYKFWETYNESHVVYMLEQEGFFPFTVNNLPSISLGYLVSVQFWPCKSRVSSLKMLWLYQWLSKVMCGWTKEGTMKLHTSFNIDRSSSFGWSITYFLCLFKDKIYQDINYQKTSLRQF